MNLGFIPYKIYDSSALHYNYNWNYYYYFFFKSVKFCNMILGIVLDCLLITLDSTLWHSFLKKKPFK